MAKKTPARTRLRGMSSVMASSTASRPNSVVNLITGFIATDEVSLKGSPTVSPTTQAACSGVPRSEEHTSELQSQSNLVCRLLLEKKKKTKEHYRFKRTKKE